MFSTAFYGCEKNQTSTSFIQEQTTDNCIEKSNLAEPLFILPEGSVVSPVGNLTAISAKFYTNIIYNASDTTQKCKFDIFIPNTATTFKESSLVIYIHGGGFNNRSKEDAYNIERHPYAADIKKYLKKGIAFVTIDFRNKDDFNVLGNTNQIEHSLGDIKRCLQFLKYNSVQLKINKNKIGVYGGSSGGCASLWLGLNDNMASVNSEEIMRDSILGESTRVLAVGHYNSQCSLDKQFLIDTYFNNENSCLFPGSVDPSPNLNFPLFITADDPDLYIFNDNDTDCSTTDKISHHPYHAIILKNKIDEVWPTGISTGKMVVTIPIYSIPAAGSVLVSKNKSLFNFMCSRLK